MFGKVALGVAALLISTMPAWADASLCGDAPPAPALPSASQITQDAPADASKAKHQAFEDVIHWQHNDLKTYRDCINAAVKDDNRKIANEQTSGDKDASDKIASLKADVTKLNSMYDSTVDTEKSVVGEFVAISNAYCTRTDVDRATCPKPQH